MLVCVSEGVYMSHDLELHVGWASTGNLAVQSSHFPLYRRVRRNLFACSQTNTATAQWAYSHAHHSINYQDDVQMYNCLFSVLCLQILYFCRDSEALILFAYIECRYLP